MIIAGIIYKIVDINILFLLPITAILFYIVRPQIKKLNKFIDKNKAMRNK
jgi:hypothetical protein